MAGNNYMNRGGYANDQNKARYICSDQECRIVSDDDALGRKSPVIYDNPNNYSSESYVNTSAERIVEHVRVTEYQYAARAKYEPLPYYGVTNDKYGQRPSVYERPKVTVTEYSPPKVEPAKNYYGTEDKWGRLSSPVRDRPYEPRNNALLEVEIPRKPEVSQRPSSTVTEYSPPKVEPAKNYYGTEEIRNNALLEVGIPKPEVSQKPSSTVYERPKGTVTEYSPPKVEPAKNDYVTKEKLNNALVEVGIPIPKVSQPMLYRGKNLPNQTNSIGKNNNSKDYYPQRNNGFTEPGTIANRDLVTGTPISAPTNDIEKIVETLKEAAKSSLAAPQQRFTAPASRFPKRDTNYVQTIDSREAAKRYGSLNMSSRPGQNYRGTINSRDAAEKYKGTPV